MSYLSRQLRQDAIFRQEAKREGMLIGALSGFAAGIIFACAWIIAWALFFKG